MTGRWAGLAGALVLLCALPGSPLGAAADAISQEDDGTTRLISPGRPGETSAAAPESRNAARPPAPPFRVSLAATPGGVAGPELVDALLAGARSAADRSPAGCHLSVSLLAAVAVAGPMPLPAGRPVNPTAVSRATARVAAGLCADGRDLTDPADLRTSLRELHDSSAYVQLVATLRARFVHAGLDASRSPVLVPLRLDEARLRTPDALPLPTGSASRRTVPTTPVSARGGTGSLTNRLRGTSRPASAGAPPGAAAVVPEPPAAPAEPAPAEPTSAEPTSAEPTSAEPTSAEPTPTMPATAIAETQNTAPTDPSPTEVASGGEDSACPVEPSITPDPVAEGTEPVAAPTPTGSVPPEPTDEPESSARCPEPGQAEEPAEDVSQDPIAPSAGTDPLTEP